MTAYTMSHVEESLKKSNKTTTVCGKAYRFASDCMARGTFAKCEETGEVRQISFSGYVSKDLSVRKAIAISFDLPTFRK